VVAWDGSVPLTLRCGRWRADAARSSTIGDRRSGWCRCTAPPGAGRVAGPAARWLLHRWRSPRWPSAATALQAGRWLTWLGW
jgi:hypothetical protein